MKLKLLILPLLIIFLVLSPKDTFAKENFQIDISSTYQLHQREDTHITTEVTITNLVSEIYSNDFILTINGMTPTDIQVYEGTEKLKFTQHISESISTLRVDFNKAIVGKDKTRKFTIEFNEASIATKTGEVWEIAIPKIDNPENFNSYEVSLIVPDEFGNEAYMSPTPTTESIVNKNKIYTFTKEIIAQSGITAGFGNFQIFNFNLSYHLENPLSKDTVVTLALPPDTSTQRISLTKIDPEPTKIALDSDGNWLANFQLKARERVDVVVLGQAEVFGTPSPNLTVTEGTLQENLSETKYWQVNDPAIKKLAQTLNTPQKIYNYVVNVLNYDNERARPNVVRRGAVEALANPESAICMEFTDLFVALARAAGIPAREINGYAYSINPDIEPLGLVADVLHSWAEYWDFDSKTWIPVDPTWGHTTGGIDYFTKLDMRHIAFVIHGKDDTKPYPPGSYKLGPNPQKDVFVNLGQIPTKEANEIKLYARRISTVPYFPGRVRVTVTNKGPRAEYGLTPSLSYNDKVVTNKFVEVLLPYSTYEFEEEIPFSFFGRNTPEHVTVSAAGISLAIPTLKDVQVVLNLLITSVILVVAIIILLIRMHKIRLPKFFKYQKR